jgi:sulfur carrier protein ThiS
MTKPMATLKLFASLSQYLPATAVDNRLDITVESDTTIAAIIERFNLPEKLVHLVLVNGVYIDPSDRAQRVLQSGEVLAIWPPVAGG